MAVPGFEFEMNVSTLTLDPEIPLASDSAANEEVFDETFAGRRRARNQNSTENFTFSVSYERKGQRSRGAHNISGVISHPLLNGNS
eukprot:5630282-Pleurochrysis_carterae.AAC.1